MQRSFRQPTDYYCEEVAPIDEQICGLLAKRKELSNNNPGFPNFDRISEWSQQYGLDEEWLQRVFAYMYGHEPHCQTTIEPAEFLKFVPILKSVAVDSIIYAVTHMKQYSNASVVCVETEVNTAEPYVRLGHANFELSISPEYQCRPNGGSGQDRGMQHSFVVTPSLPDDLTGIEFYLSIKPYRREPEMQELLLTEMSVTIK